MWKIRKFSREKISQQWKKTLFFLRHGKLCEKKYIFFIKHPQLCHATFHIFLVLNLRISEMVLLRIFKWSSLETLHHLLWNTRSIFQDLEFVQSEYPTSWTVLKHYNVAKSEKLITRGNILSFYQCCILQCNLDMLKRMLRKLSDYRQRLKIPKM